MKAAKLPVVAIGKIEDLFAGRGTTLAVKTANDGEGMDQVEKQMSEVDRGLLFANLVDFDTLYGHRNDVEGYARNLERFDGRLARVLPSLRPDDLLIVCRSRQRPRPELDHAPRCPLLVPAAFAGTTGTRRTFADSGRRRRVLALAGSGMAYELFREIIA